jgi:hypothetical protein
MIASSTPFKTNAVPPQAYIRNATSAPLRRRAMKGL